MSDISREEFAGLIKRVDALESAVRLSSVRDQGQEKTLLTIQKLMAEKEEAQLVALRSQALLKRLERYVVALSLALLAAFVTFLNERTGGSLDQNVISWIVGACMIAALLTLTGHTKTIGNIADRIGGIK